MKKRNVTVSSRKETMLKNPKFGVIEKNNRERRTSSLFVIVFLFILFALLYVFIFKGKLLFTPDYTSTDAFHFNASLKHILSEKLKHNSLPFWTDQLQNGFPLLAEGQAGALFLPNIILLKLCSFVDGFNLLYIFSFYLLCTGFYFLLREIGIYSLLAIVMSLIFTFNGAISFRWVHLNLIQSFSLTPLLFLYSLKFYKTNKLRYGILISFIVSQMIFAGHYQIVFYSILALLMWYTLLLIVNKKNELFKHLYIKSFFLLNGFLLALPQIIPTFKFAFFSHRNLFSSYDFAVSFPLTPKHLISFFFPYPFGSPKNASYPLASSINWGIFWENSPYLGPFFVLLILISIVVIFKSKLLKLNYFYIVLILVFIALSLGKDSPLYFIFSLFPFNIFRVPSKYLLLANLFIILFTSILLNYYFLKKKKLWSAAVIIIALFNLTGLLSIVFSYHLFADSAKLLRPSPFNSYIKKNDVVMNFKTEDIWLKQYTEKGWLNTKDIEHYIFLKNAMQPNTNALFSKKNIQVNTGGLKLSRTQFVSSVLYSEIKPSGTGEYKASPLFFRFAHLYNVSKIISSVKINNFILQKELQDINNKSSLFLYLVPDSFGTDFYIPNYIIGIQSVESLRNLSITTMTGNTALVENSNSFTQTPSSASVQTIQSTDTKSVFKVKTDNNIFMVLKKTWYPEWEVKIDGKNIAYYQTDLIHIGFFIPKGQHTITLEYHPTYFLYGLIISTGYLLILLFIFGLRFFLKKRSNNYFLSSK